VTDDSDIQSETPRKKRHRLRKLLLLATAIGGAVAVRQKKLAGNDAFPPPR